MSFKSLNLEIPPPSLFFFFMIHLFKTLTKLFGFADDILRI